MYELRPIQVVRLVQRRLMDHRMSPCQVGGQNYSLDKNKQSSAQVFGE